jgi:hypothetical protein
MVSKFAFSTGFNLCRYRAAYLIFCDRYRNQIMKEVHSDPTSKFTREEMQTVTTRWGGAVQLLNPQFTHSA